MFKIYLPLIVLFFFSGCVTVPIPPTGENIGKYGKLQISIMFIPNVQELLRSSNKEIKQPK
jgi:hypothetical protein